MTDNKPQQLTEDQEKILQMLEKHQKGAIDLSDLQHHPDYMVGIDDYIRFDRAIDGLIEQGYLYSIRRVGVDPEKQRWHFDRTSDTDGQKS